MHISLSNFKSVSSWPEDNRIPSGDSQHTRWGALKSQFPALLVKRERKKTINKAQQRQCERFTNLILQLSTNQQTHTHKEVLKALTDTHTHTHALNYQINKLHCEWAWKWKCFSWEMATATQEAWQRGVVVAWHSLAWQFSGLCACAWQVAVALQIRLAATLRRRRRHCLPRYGVAT